MVIAAERGHQGPDRGSSVGLYRPIKGHLMAGGQSGQGIPFLPAVLRGPSWGPQSDQETVLPAWLGLLS